MPLNPVDKECNDIYILRAHIMLLILVNSHITILCDKTV